MNRELEALKKHYIQLANNSRVKYTNFEENRFKLLEKDLEILEILKNKNIDLWTLTQVYTVGWYNMLRRHKLFNKKLTQEEFDLLKEWVNEN